MQSIALVVGPGFSLSNFDAITAFDLANLCAGRQLYSIELVSEEGGDVASSLGFPMATTAIDDSDYDTVLVGWGFDGGLPASRLAEFLRPALVGCRRLGSIGLGAFTIAATGLLDGRRVTTDWQRADDLQKRFPDVIVENDHVYLQDGNIWSSGGSGASVDMSLAMLERDVGEDLAGQVARMMLANGRRGAGQSQRSILLDLDPRTDRIQAALAYAQAHLDEPLHTEKLAEIAGLSSRQFVRTFLAETGMTPAKAVENLRLEAATYLLRQSRIPVESIAHEAGFRDRERMRRAFVRSTGKPPQVLRQEAGVLAAL